MNPGKDIAGFSHLMYQQGYSVGSEGNISVRKSTDEFYITPSNKIKNILTKKDIVLIDEKGNRIKGTGKPTSERYTHLEIYKQRPDINAIVHAHPFYTVLLNSLGVNPYQKPFLSEAVMFLKDVEISEFALPSTNDSAEKIREICKHTDIIVLDRHGSLTYAKDLQTAFSLLEIMEKYASMYYHANIGKVTEKEVRYLSAEQIAELRKIIY